jgi:hypothetical protein
LFTLSWFCRKLSCTILVRSRITTLFKTILEEVFSGLLVIIAESFLKIIVPRKICPPIGICSKALRLTGTWITALFKAILDVVFSGLLVVIAESFLKIWITS